MVALSDSRIDLIHDLLVARGVKYKPLLDDLLDHVCTAVEHKMEGGEFFEEALNQSIIDFGPEGIERTHEATIYLLTLKLRIMKKIASVIGIVGSLFAATGIILKLIHQPGAGICLVLGMGLITLFYLPLLMLIKIKESPDRISTSILTVGHMSSIVLAIGIMFKIQHWPGAGIMMLAGAGSLGLIFLPLHTIRQYRQTENKMMSLAFAMVMFAGIAVSYGMSMRGPGKGHTNLAQQSLIDARETSIKHNESLANTARVIQSKCTTNSDLAVKFAEESEDLCRAIQMRMGQIAKHHNQEDAMITFASELTKFQATLEGIISQGAIDLSADLPNFETMNKNQVLIYFQVLESKVRTAEIQGMSTLAAMQ